MEPKPLGEQEVRSFYQLHGRALIAYACSFGLDFATAQDIVHQVFLKMISGAGSVQKIGAGYLYRCVRNACLNSRRDGAKEVPIDINTTWLMHSRSDHDAEIALQRALTELPDEQREVVIMHIWGGLTLQEIAVETSTSLNTAASRYRYALEKLRMAFEVYKPKEGKTAP